MLPSNGCIAGFTSSFRKRVTYHKETPNNYNSNKIHRIIILVLPMIYTDVCVISTVYSVLPPSSVNKFTDILFGSDSNPQSCPVDCPVRSQMQLESYVSAAGTANFFISIKIYQNNHYDNKIYNLVFTHTQMCVSTVYPVVYVSSEKVSQACQLLGWDLNPGPLQFQSSAYQLDQRDCPVAKMQFKSYVLAAGTANFTSI